MTTFRKMTVFRLMVAVALGLTCGCVTTSINPGEPGVETWTLDILYEDGDSIRGQTMLLKPEDSGKNVLQVHAIIKSVTVHPTWGNYHVSSDWKGKVKDGEMTAEISGLSEPMEGNFNPGDTFFGQAKGTFSDGKANGIVNVTFTGGTRSGTWTAEKTK